MPWRDNRIPGCPVFQEYFQAQLVTSTMIRIGFMPPDEKRKAIPPRVTSLETRANKKRKMKKVQARGNRSVATQFDRLENRGFINRPLQNDLKFCFNWKNAWTDFVRCFERFMKKLYAALKYFKNLHDFCNCQQLFNAAQKMRL